MREIKFRIFAHTGKTWHHFCYDDYPHGIYGAVTEPQQFTGTQDKTGKDIYDGDIIQHFAFPKGDTFVVEWNTKNGCWDGYGCFSEWKYCTVVGNIHES
jgi:hypothetical protein